MDFSRIFEDDDGGADVLIPLKSMEKRSIDNDIDDNSNNNSNDNSNDNSNNNNDKIFPNPVLGELGTQPAVFTDETNTTPTTSATTSTSGTTKATSAKAKAKAIAKAKANSRLQSLRFRARRLQKKQWAKLQRLPLTHLVRVLHFSQSLLNLNLNNNPNPSLAHAAAEVPCVRP